ncbi:MAG: hypothetical protein KDA60_18225 [Planctomycetales bacterium]|nr:hypothetical protein [Planctomycetales bacterium]
MAKRKSTTKKKVTSKKKATSKKRGPAPDRAAESTTSGGPGYCEYYCSSNDWWLVGVHPETGYYCPLDPPGSGSCSNGSTTTIPAVPVPGGPGVQSDSAGAGRYCEYVYRNGYFHVVGSSDQGDAPELFCPADLPAYALSGDHPEFKRLVNTLRSFDDNVVEARIRIPMAWIESCKSQGHRPGDHRNRIVTADQPTCSES